MQPIQRGKYPKGGSPIARFFKYVFCVPESMPDPEGHPPSKKMTLRLHATAWTSAIGEYAYTWKTSPEELAERATAKHERAVLLREIQTTAVGGKQAMNMFFGNYMKLCVTASDEFVKGFKVRPALSVCLPQLIQRGYRTARRDQRKSTSRRGFLVM